MKGLLKKSGLKVTDNRLSILEVLKKSSAPLTAEDIYKTLENEKHMSFSTVYRSLNAMLDAGILLMQVNQDSKQYFQLNTNEHKHIVKCIICKEAVNVDFCPMKEIEEVLAKKTGYKITGHSFEFTGICPNCQKNSQKYSKKH